MIDFIDKTTEQGGTPINRDNMMAIQGFLAQTTYLSPDERAEGHIALSINFLGQKLYTDQNEDGSITQTLVGDKTISHTTYFNSDNSIVEALE